jgi:hypothetical protein
MFYFLHNNYIDYFNLLSYINPIKIFFFIFHDIICASFILFTLLQISLQKNVEKFNFKLLIPFFSIKKLVRII